MPTKAGELIEHFVWEYSLKILIQYFVVFITNIVIFITNWSLSSPEIEI